MARQDPGSDDPGWLEADGPSEVVAAAKTQRRIAIGYVLVFAIAILAVPAVTVALPWWSGSRLLGGMSPSFVTVAGGLYAFFLFLGVAAARLARRVEGQMLGTSEDEGPEP
jgi:uncharacterized membrane protein